jgi:hypothetical protein
VCALRLCVCVDEMSVCVCPEAWALRFTGVVGVVSAVHLGEPRRGFFLLSGLWFYICVERDWTIVNRLINHGGRTTHPHEPSAL